MAKQKNIAQVGPWPKGMNNLLRAESLPNDALRNCINFDIDDAGKLSVRDGKTEIYTGTILKGSLWEGAGITLFVEGGNLKRLNVDYTADVIRANIGNTPITYLEVNGVIYWSNQTVTGTIVDGAYHEWGVQVPAFQPTCTAADVGSLDAGIYQVAITHISAEGEESGALVPTTVTVSANGKIHLTDFPVSDKWTNLYVSDANSEELYLVDALFPGVTEYTVDDVSQTTRRLETANAEPPMPCDALEYFNGRIYLAVGSTVYFTDPLRYGLVRRASNFYLFPEIVSTMLAVSDGLYVCSDQTYLLAGVDTQDALQRAVLPYGAVKGSGVRIPNADAVAWFSERGFVIAGVGGEVKNLTEGSIAVSTFEEGRMVFVEQSGIRRLVSVLRSGTPNYHVASDYKDAETSRRGDFI